MKKGKKRLLFTNNSNMMTTEKALGKNSWDNSEKTYIKRRKIIEKSSYFLSRFFSSPFSFISILYVHCCTFPFHWRWQSRTNHNREPEKGKCVLVRMYHASKQTEKSSRLNEWMNEWMNKSSNSNIHSIPGDGVCSVYRTKEAAVNENCNAWKVII